MLQLSTSRGGVRLQGYRSRKVALLQLLILTQQWPAQHWETMEKYLFSSKRVKENLITMQHILWLPLLQTDYRPNLDERMLLIPSPYIDRAVKLMH